MTAVFLDTVGLIGLWNIDDQWHSAAEIAFQILKTDRRRLVTTEFVLAECGNGATRLAIRSIVAEFRQRFIEQRLLIEVTAEELQSAWSAFGGKRKFDPSLVDEISIAVMGRLGIGEVFSNDVHFKRAGFTVLF